MIEILKRAGSWLDISSTDPDNARRGKLLNIILAGIFILCVLMQVVAISFWFTVPHQQWMRDVSKLFGASLGLLVASVLLFIVNRRVSGWLAGALFLFIFTLAITLVDKPEQLVSGRSLFLFTIPIFLASMLMPSWVAFIAVGMCMTIMSIIEISILNGSPFDLMPTFLTLLFIALLAWLSSRSVEHSLRDLRAINVNLDRLVQERTQALADALSRERIEAGRIKAILESIADAVIVFDRQGVAIIANPSCRSLLGVPLEQIVNTHIVELSRVKQLDTKNGAALVNLLSNPGQQEASSHIQWGDKTLSATSAEVFDTENNPIGTVAVFRDYTHEAELDKMKDTFLAIVSHELRTPLNAILGYAEMLKEAIYGPINAKQVRASERILTNTQRLLAIVNDLLDQSQMQAGKMTMHVQPFRPTELIDNVHGVMDKISADKGLTLTSQLDTSLPYSIYGDASRLNQIIVNLVNNAIKFTDKGTVNFCILRTDPQHWAIEVRDTGIGIPENELPHIFEAFKQVDSSATRKYGGFGLGLSIVRQLANLMGGKVNVSSKVGIGSTFTVTLPLIQQGGQLI